MQRITSWFCATLEYGLWWHKSDQETSSTFWLSERSFSTLYRPWRALLPTLSSSVQKSPLRRRADAVLNSFVQWTFSFRTVSLLLAGCNASCYSKKPRRPESRNYEEKLLLSTSLVSADRETKRLSGECECDTQQHRLRREMAYKTLLADIKRTLSCPRQNTYRACVDSKAALGCTLLFVQS